MVDTMVYRFVAVAVIILSNLVLLAQTAGAVDAKSQGLFISPLRQEVTLSPGQPIPVNVTIGDLTNKPMKVDLNVKQFSVADYTYQYQFLPLVYDWVEPASTSVALQPGQKMQVHFTVKAPQNVAAGGYYFALFASTMMADREVRSTVQAASLLYTKTDGEDAKQSATILDAHVASFVTGGEIPFKFNVKDTGNVHIDGRSFAQMEGLLGKSPSLEADHILLPGKTRTMSGTLPSPVLPGIYTLTYGYKGDSSAVLATHSSYIVFIPPWFVVALLLLGLLFNMWRRKKRHQKETSDTTA